MSQEGDFQASKFEMTVLDHVRKNSLLEPGSHVVVGFSGGVDSLVLLDFLNRHRETLGITLMAVHVHHGIRGEYADRDAHFSEEFCLRNGIGFKLFKRDIPSEARDQGIGMEEAGRKARYELFDKVLAEHPKGVIAVAHHADDQAETLLMRLFRGSGLDGMTAMKPRRGNVVRPFLRVTKEEIRAYGLQWKLTSIEDETNESTEYLRNRLRHQLIPWLKEHVNTNVIERLNDAALLLEADRSYLEEEADNIRQSVFRESEEFAEADLTDLSEIQDVMLSRIIRHYIRQWGSLRDMGMAEMNELIRLIRKGSHNKNRTSGGVSFSIVYDRLQISCSDLGSKSGHRIEITLVERSVFDSQKLGIDEVAIDADCVKGNLEIRYRHEGDVFQPFGMAHHKKLKKFFIDEKIPARERSTVPLVVDRTIHGDIIVWVCPYRLSELYRITGETSKIAILRVCSVVH